MNCEHLCLKPRIHGIGVGPRSPASETALQPQADRLGVHALMHVGVPVRVCTEPVLTSTAAAALENDDVHDFHVASMLSMAAKAQLRASVMIRVGDECTCTYTHTDTAVRIVSSVLGEGTRGENTKLKRHQQRQPPAVIPVPFDLLHAVFALPGSPFQLAFDTKHAPIVPFPL